MCLSGKYVLDQQTGIFLCMHPANERRSYIVASSLISWVHTQNDPWTQYCEVGGNNS